VDSELFIRAVVLASAASLAACAGMGKNENVDYRVVVASPDRSGPTVKPTREEIRSCCSRSPVLGRG